MPVPPRRLASGILRKSPASFDTSTDTISKNEPNKTLCFFVSISPFNKLSYGYNIIGRELVFGIGRIFVPAWLAVGRKM